MSILCDVAGDQLYQTTQYTKQYNTTTICGWARHRSFTGNDMVVQTGGGGANPFTNFFFRSGNILAINDGATSYDFASTPANNAWFFWALTHDSSNRIGYWCYPHARRLLAATFADTISADTNLIRIAGGTYGGPDCLFGDSAQVRVWSANLSYLELLREMLSPSRPARLANLEWWCPLESDLRDRSGHGRVWTVGGSVGWGAALNVGRRSVVVLPSWVLSGAVTPDNYGTPYDHSGTKPYSSLWRPARA